MKILKRNTGFTPLEINKSLSNNNGNTPSRRIKRGLFLSLTAVYPVRDMIKKNNLRLPKVDLSLTGFTLLEILFAVAILAIVGVIAFNGFYGGFSLWNTLDIKIQLQQEARKAINSITNELRKTNHHEVDVLDVDGDGDGDEIIFTLPPLEDGLILVDNGSIVWSESDGTVQFHRVDHGGVSRLIKTVTRPEGSGCSGGLCQYGGLGGGSGGGSGGVFSYGGGSGNQIDYGDFPVANYIDTITFQENEINNEVRVFITVKRANFLRQEQSITLTSTIKLRN